MLDDVAHCASTFTLFIVHGPFDIYIERLSPTLLADEICGVIVVTTALIYRDLWIRAQNPRAVWLSIRQVRGGN